MQDGDRKKILVSGASFAGLSTAYWMRRHGHDVTVVETARGLRTGGTAVNIEGRTVDIVRSMGILEHLRANQLNLELWEFKNEHDVTEGSAVLTPQADALEVERDTLLASLFGLVKEDVDFVFDEGVTSLRDVGQGVEATFRSGSTRTFDLVFGCDGSHSAVRKLWFGKEAEYTHFLEQYFAITIVEKSLIRPNTAQLFNVPCKGIMLNAHGNKTDVVFCFVSEEELPYDHRDEAQQRRIVAEQFSDVGWRAPELLKEVSASNSFYFDKLCQIRMPTWTKGRVALVGDAGYCASPAAGKGGSLALDGAAALADAFSEHPGDFEAAFRTYDSSFRPYVEEVQSAAVQFGLESLCPRTEAAIRKRNSQEVPMFDS